MPPPVFDEDLDINQLQEATDELNSALSDLNMTETSDDQGDEHGPLNRLMHPSV